MKIAIIGAGWYGCHLALSLLQKDIDIKIFEKKDRTISGSSRYNQNRLHQGFHYPRDYETRRQSNDGFEWFLEHYGSLLKDVPNNVYGVANKTSNIDFQTYKHIMSASKLEFQDISDKAFSAKFDNIQGMVSTSEKLILNHRASHYFDDVLSKHLEFGKEINMSDKNVLELLKSEYDYVLDCTWGTSRKIPNIDYYYEPCMYFYYRKKIKEHFAFTLMDGNFFSIYPYDDDIYTVTSVANTPIGQVKYKDEISALFDMARKSEYIDAKRMLFENEIKHYYPGFLNDFEYSEPVYSLKTKLVSGTDFRGCLVKKEDNLISVFSGKIDTLHIAELEVLKMIEVKDDK